MCSRVTIEPSLWGGGACVIVTCVAWYGKKDWPGIADTVITQDTVPLVLSFFSLSFEVLSNLVHHRILLYAVALS